MERKVVRFPSWTVLLFLFSVFIALGQEHGPNNPDLSVFENHQDDLQNKVLDSLLLWQEKVVLHVDKEVFAPRDILFFKAYTLTGPKHIRVSGSRVMKLELLDSEGNLVKSQNHKIEKGMSHGSFEIPKKIADGNYYLRAYTHWMLNYGPENFAVKGIKIGNAAIQSEVGKDIQNSISIFPEGGNLVNGLTNRVAVNFANHIQEDLEVVNANGEKVGHVKKYGNGMGTFLLKPEAGESYSIKSSDGETIELPEANQTGYAIQVSNLDKEYIRARIAVSPTLKNEPVYISGKRGNIDYFKELVVFGNTNDIEVTIPREKLPEGILHVQLEDESGRIWAKRSLYNERKKLDIALQTNSYEDGRRALQIRVTDLKGNPVETELSVTLGEKMIEQVSFPSNHRLRNERYFNDLLLLTDQSSKLLTGKSISAFPSEIKYNFQEGVDFFGQAYDLNKSLLANTKIQVLIFAENEVIAEEVTTNAEGLFKLLGLSYTGEINMVFRTAGEETANQLVQVIPFVYETPPLFGKKVETIVTAVQDDEDSEENVRKKVSDFFFNEKTEDELIALREVTLSGTKALRKTRPSNYGLQPNRVKFQDKENPKTIPQLFLGIPGVYVTGIAGLYPRVTILQGASVGPILWVLDGFPLMQPTSLVDIMNLISYYDVERVEVLTGPQAAIYGTRAAGGVISIYTRNGSGNGYLNRKEAQISFEGFHESIAFEAYKKEVPKKVLKMDDIPTTVYWNPELKTDENGVARISFEAPEDLKTLYLDIQAITEDGKKGNLRTAVE